GTSGSPFLTPQKAWNHVIRDLDLNGHNVTINVADGTYAPVLCYGTPIGWNGAPIAFIGNTTTPANCTISATSNNAITVGFGASISASGFDLSASGTTGTTSAQGSGIIAVQGGQIIFTSMRFGTCGFSHLYAASGGIIQAYNTAYTIHGNAPNHVTSGVASIVNLINDAITLTGTPAFSTA